MNPVNKNLITFFRKNEEQPPLKKTKQAISEQDSSCLSDKESFLHVWKEYIIPYYCDEKMILRLEQVTKKISSAIEKKWQSKGKKYFRAYRFSDHEGKEHAVKLNYFSCQKLEYRIDILDMHTIKEQDYDDIEFDLVQEQMEVMASKFACLKSAFPEISPALECFTLHKSMQTFMKFSLKEEAQRDLQQAVMEAKIAIQRAQLLISAAKIDVKEGTVLFAGDNLICACWDLLPIDKEYAQTIVLAGATYAIKAYLSPTADSDGTPIYTKPKNAKKIITLATQQGDFRFVQNIIWYFLHRHANDLDFPFMKIQRLIMKGFDHPFVRSILAILYFEKSEWQLADQEYTNLYNRKKPTAVELGFIFGGEEYSIWAYVNMKLENYVKANEFFTKSEQLGYVLEDWKCAAFAYVQCELKNCLRAYEYYKKAVDLGYELNEFEQAIFNEIKINLEQPNNEIMSSPQDRMLARHLL